MNLSLGITALIGTPIAAAISSITGSYTPAIIYAGVMLFLGAISVIFVQFRFHLSITNVSSPTSVLGKRRRSTKQYDDKGGV